MTGPVQVAFGLRVGDRIVLTGMADDPDPIEAGATGTITGFTVAPQIEQIVVEWDPWVGRSLMLVPGRDKWKRIIRAKPAQVGCWIDGTHGWQATGRMVEIASDHGFPITKPEQITLEQFMRGDGEYNDIADLADEAETWLDEYVAPDGYYFVWHDGEFFLTERPQDDKGRGRDAD